MNRQKIIVPEGIRFLLDWEWFSLDKFPNKCIINKQIPGCGFTEYCIRSSENIILCSPRKLLLKNKFDQHKNEVYLVVNEMDKDPNVDKDISKLVKTSSNKSSNDSEKIIEVTKEIKNKRDEIYKRLYSEIEEYKIKCFLQNRPMKVLVTYDSYHIVVDILNKLNIFQHDSRFKSDTELSFLNNLQFRSHSALFVSATPMMDEYLEMLSEFKDLPYYELDWYTEDNSRVTRPDLKVLTMKSIGSKAEEVIGKYLRREFEEITVIRNNVPTKVVSDELVVYVNSVNHIISIIKKLGIQPEQVNILCSDTEENKRRIKKRLGKDYSIGSVPLEGEKPKLITFCTRTVYLGADFYSLCAKTVIFSDSNSDCLAVDISEDLPQILGRQRLEENPWKNSATFFYRVTADYKKMSAEDFQNIINTKRRKTENLLGVFDTASESAKQDLAEKYKRDIDSNNYKDDYVAVNKFIDEFGNISLRPVLNNLVLVNELRAFKIQQIDYADRFAVFAAIHNKLAKETSANKEAYEFLEEYNSLTEARKKLIMLCEYGLSREAAQIVLSQIPDSDYIKSYYLALGPQRLKNLGYKRNNIERELGIVTFSPELLIQEIYSNFKENEKYTLANLKNKLTGIYSSINYFSTPKANDILGYFEVKEFMTTAEVDGKKKRVRGYELLKSKEQELRLELKHAQ